MFRFVKPTYLGCLLRLNLLKNSTEGAKFLLIDSSSLFDSICISRFLVIILSSDIVIISFFMFFVSMPSRVKVIVASSSHGYPCLLSVVISLFQRATGEEERQISK